MNKNKYVFTKLVGFLDNFKFLRIVKKYDGDKYAKSYTYWNQLLTMMFGQLSNRESFRDLIVALKAHAGKVYHLGIGKSVIRSNLSKANEQRAYRIFEEFAFFMIAETRKRRIQKIFELDGHVYAFDSTTIDLCLSVFKRAKFRKHKGGFKMHTLYNAEAQVAASVHITEAKVHDSKAMPEIPYENDAHYIFDRGYNDFGNLYTVRVQIYCAIITYCLVAIAQHDMKLELSIYEVLQILGISLTDKNSLRDLFDKSNFKNVNVLCDSSEPNLFNL